MTPEGRVKAKVRAWLKRLGIWFYCPVSNGMGAHGIPDFVCVVKGRFLGIETKAPGKRRNVSELQKMQGRSIVDAGGLWFVVDNPEEDLPLIEAVLAGKAPFIFELKD